MRLSFHSLVPKDLRGALGYYEDEAGPEIARRFQEEFEGLATAIEENPKRFHGVAGSRFRRANFRSFPYHLLFEETAGGPRVLVLRHHRRHPDYGMGRK
jgi:plasmid stabilization system protein ParE